jgi:MMP 1-O-methyltransferase
MGRIIKNKLNDIINFTRGIDGWLSNQEGYFLLQLANSLPSKAVIVEIGSWKGKSTIWLGNGIKNNPGAKLFSVDPHVGSQDRENEYNKVNTLPEFNDNIRKSGLGKQIISIREFSETAVKKFSAKIDLLFIDGDHQHDAARQDFNLWSSKLNNGAWVVFHDATVLPGPWLAARNGLLLSTSYVNTGMIGSIIYGQYSENSGLLKKIWNVSRNLTVCLFVITYVKMRKIDFPKSLRNKIRRLNFKWRINRLKNVATKNNHHLN